MKNKRNMALTELMALQEPVVGYLGAYFLQWKLHLQKAGLQVTRNVQSDLERWVKELANRILNPEHVDSHDILNRWSHPRNDAFDPQYTSTSVSPQLSRTDHLDVPVQFELRHGTDATVPSQTTSRQKAQAISKGKQKSYGTRSSLASSEHTASSGSGLGGTSKHNHQQSVSGRATAQISSFFLLPSICAP